MLAQHHHQINKIRNFGILAHIDSGKTTVSERMLYYSGATHVDGEVHHGNTTMDFNDLERQKGITISSAVTSTVWQQHQLNLIDTPGHVDFTAEVERSCRVLDGAVMVLCGVAGVQAQSETVWRQAQRHGVPRVLFINKMDRDGADFWQCLAAAERQLHAKPAVVAYPYGSGQELHGVIDVRQACLLRFTGPKGQTVERQPLPASEQTRVAELQQRLQEYAAEQSEALLNSFIDNGSLDAQAVSQGLRLGTISGHLQPCLGGSALGHVGIQTLLDAIVEFLPDPLSVETAEYLFDRDDASVGQVTAQTDAPLVALVYKVVHDEHGDIAYVRVYQGSLNSGMAVIVNADPHCTDRATRLVRIEANRRVPTDTIGPGDLCGVIGLKRAVTGDTLSTSTDPVRLRGIQFAEPVISMAVETVSSASSQALAMALRAMEREDPTFQVRSDPETGQRLLAGMGELHLETIAHRLEHGFKVPIRLGQPQVGLRARITKSCSSRGVYRKQNGGPGSYAICELDIRPCSEAELAAADDGLIISDQVKGGAIDKVFMPAIRNGVMQALASGGPQGERIAGVHVTIRDGAMHQQDSNEHAFVMAGRLAVQEALPQLGVQCLEPWMQLEISCTGEHTGAVIASLHSKRGVVKEISANDEQRLVQAEAPLAALFGYIAELRGLSSGRASYTAEPAGFRPVAN